MVQLQKYEEDERCKKEMPALVPSEAEMKVIQTGNGMATAGQKMAMFHEAVIRGTTLFVEKEHNNYILAFDALSAPLKDDEEWEDHYRSISSQLPDPDIPKTAYTGLLATSLRTQFQVWDSRTTFGGAPLTRESVLCSEQVVMPLRDYDELVPLQQTLAEVHVLPTEKQKSNQSKSKLSHLVSFCC